MSQIEETSFMKMLTRGNKEIQKARALDISESLEMIFKRKVEDLASTLKKLKRRREGMLDLSPTNTQSLIVGKNFEPEKFLIEDLNFGIEIRETEIRHDIVLKRYEELFGKFPGETLKKEAK
jgi:hypothetical protein